MLKSAVIKRLRDVIFRDLFLHGFHLSPHACVARFFDFLPFFGCALRLPGTVQQLDDEGANSAPAT